MANIIKPKRSESTGQTPTLSPGELAVNIADKKVWVANSSGTPVLIVDGNASISETDPVFSASAAFSITTTDVTNWNTAYGWGDHSAAGYLTTETDPVFNASTAASITSTDTGNWNTAYGWGDHSAAGYLTTETDPTFTASAAYSITTTDIGNWNTAYGWGDHSTAGYLTTETDPVFTASDAASITATDIGNWNAKPDTVTVTSTGATITVTDNTVGGTVSFNVETPQGVATTDSPTFAGLTAAGLVYPTTDGTSGQVIVTDGAGNLSFATGGGSGTVTSITGGSYLTGGTITTTGTLAVDATSENTASKVVARDASGNFSAGTITASLIGTASTATNVSGGSGGTIHYQSAPDTTAMLSNGTSNQILQANGGTSAPSWVSTLTGVTVSGLKETKTAPSISSGTLTLDCSVGNVFAVSLNANITTLSFTNVPATGTAYGLTLMLTADGTARTITWGGSVKWASGTAPTLTSTSGKVDVFVLMTHDGTNWYGFTSGQNL